MHDLYYRMSPDKRQKYDTMNEVNVCNVGDEDQSVVKKKTKNIVMSPGACSQCGLTRYIPFVYDAVDAIANDSTSHHNVHVSYM